MSENYRRQLEWCLMVGERVSYSYEAHRREVVLEALRSCVKEKEYDRFYVCEEAEVEDMLWILREEDVAIVAPPALMALVMGEYDLAIRLCEDYRVTSWKNRVNEVYMHDGKAVWGNNYSFGEACLFCKDISASQLQYFAKRGFFDKNNFVYEGACYWRRQQEAEEAELVWRPLRAVKMLCDEGEFMEEVLKQVMLDVLERKIDIICTQFWERVFELFTRKKERVVIVEAVHSYFYDRNNYIFCDRFQKALSSYFQCEDGLPMIGAIEKYIVHRVIAEFQKGSLFRDRLVDYFGIVRRLEGQVNRGWNA